MKFDAEKKVNLKGAYCQEIRPDFMIEQLDTSMSLNYFSENIKDNFLSSYYNISIDTIIPGEYDGDINYTVEFDITKPNYNPAKIISFDVGEFIELGPLLRSPEKEERASDAYFDFPYSKKLKLYITTNKSYSFVNNTLLDIKETNGFASLKSKHKVLGNVLEIDIEFSLLKSVCEKDEWSNFVEINQELEDYLKSKIVIIKTM